MLLHNAKKNLTKLFLPLIAAQSLALASCADDLFKEFKVEGAALNDGKACALFSAPVDAISARKNFTLVQDDALVDGQILVNENSLVFVPVDGLPENHTYKIKICAGTKDKDGNSLQFDYEKTFETRKDLTPPQAVEIKESGEGLEIAFNKAIDEKSFLENFSVCPKKDFFARWNQSKSKVEIAFKDKLEEGTLYSVKIDAGLLDSFNNKMQKEFLWSWTNGQKAAAIEPQFFAWKFGQSEKTELGGVFEALDMSKGIEILLGKNDAFESLKDALFIEPNITFDVRQDGAKALIEFKEKLKWNETFYLFINGGKFKERKIEVKNNAEELRPPRLEFAVFEADGKTIILDEQDNYQNVSFPLADYPAGQEIDFPIWFVYSISGAAGRVDKISAMEATGVNANFCASVSLKTVKALSQEEFDMTSEFFSCPSVRQKILSLQAQGKRLSLVDFGAVFANKEAASKPARGLLEFKVSKKLCDDMKNFMEESAALSCNKN